MLSGDIARLPFPSRTLLHSSSANALSLFARAFSSSLVAAFAGGAGGGCGRSGRVARGEGEGDGGEREGSAEDGAHGLGVAGDGRREDTVFSADEDRRQDRYVDKVQR
jgi:hypothetical protein